MNLSPREAANVLNCAELRLGRSITKEEMFSGELTNILIEEDYKEAKKVDNHIHCLIT